MLPAQPKIQGICISMLPRVVLDSLLAYMCLALAYIEQGLDACRVLGRLYDYMLARQATMGDYKLH